MIALPLILSELLIIFGGIVAVLIVGPATSPAQRFQHHRRIWAYRRHRKQVEARSHIAFYADMLDQWDAERQGREIR